MWLLQPPWGQSAIYYMPFFNLTYDFLIQHILLIQHLNLNDYLPE